MKRKKTLAAGAAALALALLLAGCGGTAAQSTSASGGESNMTALTSESSKVKAEDLDASWEESTATKITLEGSTATVEGSGATAEGSTVTITAGGTYVVSGTLDDGQIFINAPADNVVRLVLNGAHITNTTSSPLYCEEADKLIVILAEGTENTLTDGANYTFPDENTDEPNAALFSRQDLTINGTGALTVNANYNNGIGTKDDLIIVSGTLTVTAPNHALRGRDSVTVLDGTLNLTAGNDGIQSNNTDADKGWVELYGGSFTIQSEHDGIQAESALTISGGEYDITAGGGSANAPQRTEEGPGGFGGGQPPEGMEMPDFSGEMPDFNGEPPNFENGQAPEGAPGTASQESATATALSATDETSSGSESTDASQPADSGSSEAAGDNSTGDATTDTAAEDTTSDSYKGLKAGGDLTITGGTFTIDSADDSIHSNANITISGGTFTLATGDDGVHADTTLTIEGEPVIDITQSYEGLESADVTIKGGTITIVASDDGINAAGGRDASTEGTEDGGFGPDMFSKVGDYTIRIEGGTIDITAGTDGLDSNGDIELAGGTVTLQMTNLGGMGGDGVIDRDGALVVTGGTLLGSGANGAVLVGASLTDEGSTQAMGEVYYSTTQAAGTPVEVQDAEGNVIANFTPTQDFTCVVFTAPGMAEGETVTVYTGGEKTLDITLSGTLTSLQDTGEAAQKDQGGPGGGGGRGNRQNMQPGQNTQSESASSTQ